MIVQFTFPLLSLKQEEVTSNCVAASLKLPSSGQWNFQNKRKTVWEPSCKASSFQLKYLSFANRRGFLSGSGKLAFMNLQKGEGNIYEFAGGESSLIAQFGFFWSAGKIMKDTLICPSYIFDRATSCGW